MIIVDTLERLDQKITLAVNSLHHPILDKVWTVFSDKEIWYVLYGAVLVFFFVRLGWKKALLVTLSCILTVVACDQFANFTKALFERLRPCWDGFMISNGLHIVEGRGNLYGFYSAHAANAMGFAVCSYLGFRSDKTRRYRLYLWFICTWGFLVGISRIFLGKHFVGDVFTGFFIGWLFAWLIAMAIRSSMKKMDLLVH